MVSLKGFRVFKFFIGICVLLSVVSEIDAASKKGLQPQLAISPSRVELQPDEVNATKSVTVLNLGAEPMQVEVSVQNWDFDENNNYRALPPTPQSLDQWLIINPVRLTIPAKGQQTVRMAIRPKARPEAGEHRAMVFFKQVRSEKAKGVNVLFNVGVPVYAFFGDVKREATLHRMSYNAETFTLDFDITSSGNAYVRPKGFFAVFENVDGSEQELLSKLDTKTGEVEKDAAIVSGKVSSKPVFAGERRLVSAVIPDDKLPESYALVVKVDVAGTLYENVYRVRKEQ